MGLIPQRDYFDKDIANSDNTSGYYIIEQNNFVYNPRKSSDAPYGPISRYAYPDAGIVSPLYLCFRAKGNVDTSFFEWYFRSSAWHRYIYMTGDSGARHDRVSIKDDDFFSMPIRFPSAIEQKKIAAFLNTIERRITSQQLFVDNLKKYKRGLNHKLLSEIDGQNYQELGTVCSIVGGGTPDTLRPEYWKGNVEWFTPSEIGKSKYVLSSLRKISRLGLSNSSAKLLPAGAVLLTTRATLGEMSIARSECSTNQGFQSLIADSKRVLPEYLYYLQILIKPWCEKYASGNTFREISKASLSKCVVPVPCLNSQKRIVCILSRIDDLIETHERANDSLTQIKEGLLQQLFI